MQVVLLVRIDRGDHQVESIGAVYEPRGAVDVVRDDLLGFAEVVQAIDALCVLVFHYEHHAKLALSP